MHVKFIESSAILILWTFTLPAHLAHHLLISFFFFFIHGNQETKKKNKKKSEEYDFCCLQEWSVLVLIYGI